MFFEDFPIDKLPFTSSITKRRLKFLDIHSYWNLINYFPFRYKDYSIVLPISKLKLGDKVTIKGKITQSVNLLTKKSRKIQKICLNDGSGSLNLIWYNQPYLVRLFRVGQFLSVSGEAKMFMNQLVFYPDEYELLKDRSQTTLHTGRLVPVYPEKKGLTSRLLRQKIHYLLTNIDNIVEILPKEIIKKNELISEKDAYFNIHFPNSINLSQLAKTRLSFDELFVIQLSTQLIKNKWKKQTISNCLINNLKIKNKLEKFIKSLPFKLTGSQKKCLSEIIDDLTKENPMNRLLQGDVGSGKTVVAAIGAYFNYLNGYQTLLMAPTEILAYQHYQTIKSLFLKLNIKVGLQTKSKKISELKNKIKVKDYDLIIGTHALLNKDLEFDKVSFVIIDEQQRFGVAQRAMLKKKGLEPHLLTMTATPIPRTVALTLYRELDVSLIDEMPKGRVKIKSYLVQNNKRDKAYNWIKKKILKEKIQVYIICPLIEESTHETMKSVKAVTTEYQFLKSKVFKDFKLGILHGKMKSKEKDKTMEDFKKNKYNILVATSVVEVGIDIPNSTIIIIETADRYGLAQLHQLRGRVGRSDKQSYCFVFTDVKDNRVLERLEYFCKNDSGLQLAEYDLKIRGPGNIYGVKQHGYSLLKIASFNDYSLINRTNKAVTDLLENYSGDLKMFPLLEKRILDYQTDLISKD